LSNTENKQLLIHSIGDEWRKKYHSVKLAGKKLYANKITGAPNDRFLSNAFKRCFRLSGVLLRLCRLILGCAEKILSVRLFKGNLSILEFIRTFVSISRKP